METEGIEMSVEIYNTIVSAYRVVQQFDEALIVLHEMLKLKRYNLKSITHMLKCNIGKMQNIDCRNEKQGMLCWIERDLVALCKAFGPSGEHTLRTIQFGNAMLDAYVAANPELSSAQFEGVCAKYNVQYWDTGTETQPPTVDLYIMAES